MALRGQALGHSLLLGVPQENARHRPLFLCESEKLRSSKGHVLIVLTAIIGLFARRLLARTELPGMGR